jgi:hypothetical protein
MNPLQRIARALDSLWSAIDPDEPVLCGCRTTFTCPDCALGTPLDAAPPWPSAGASLSA